MSYFDDFYAEVQIAEDEAFDLFEKEAVQVKSWVELLMPTTSIRILDKNDCVLWVGDAGKIKDKRILKSKMISMKPELISGFENGFEIKTDL